MMEDHDVSIAKARYKRETSHLIGVHGVREVDNLYEYIVDNIEWIDGVVGGCT